MKRVLFVCTGNICRSPTAEGVLRKLVAEAGLADAIAVDSAGTTDYHTGEAPDARAQAHRAGYEIVAGTPAELANRLATEIAATKELVTRLGIKPE